MGLKDIEMCGTIHPEEGWVTCMNCGIRSRRNQWEDNDRQCGFCHGLPLSKESRDVIKKLMEDRAKFYHAINIKKVSTCINFRRDNEV